MRIWIDPSLKIVHRGDRFAARALTRKVRKLAGHVLDSFKGKQAFGGYKKRIGENAYIQVYVWNDLHGPRAVCKVVAAGEEERSLISGFLAIVWRPEGIMLTPRTDAAEYGFTFPKRDPETGELDDEAGAAIESEGDECLNQVLINRFENNKYLDQPAFVTGDDMAQYLPENLKLRESLEGAQDTFGFYQHWNPLFEPADEDFSFEAWEPIEEDEDVEDPRKKWVDLPGFNQWETEYSAWKPLKAGSLFQFKEDGSDYLYEQESDTWFVHRPQEILHPNALFEEIHRLTNEARTDAGLRPFTRPLRGNANPALLVCAEMQRSGVMKHEAPGEYRLGYETFTERLRLCAGLNGGGENLLVGPVPLLTSETEAEGAVEWWMNSTAHREQILNEAFDSPKYGTSLNVFGGLPATITKDQSGAITSPISGAVYAQVFNQYGPQYPWLAAALVHQSFDGGTVGLSTTSQWRLGFLYNELRAFGVIHQGRLHVIQQVLDSRTGVTDITQTIFGAAIYTDDETKHPWLRAIVLVMDTPYNLSTEGSIISYIKPVASSALEWQVEEERELGSLGVYFPCELTTLFSWKKDGQTGVCAMSFYIPEEREVYDYLGQPAMFHALYGRPAVLRFSNGVFSMTERDLPRMQFTSEIEDDPTSILNEEPPTRDRFKYITRSLHGTYSIYPYYDDDDNLRYITQQVSFDCTQRPQGDLVFYNAESFTLANGQTIPLSRVLINNYLPSGECFRTLLLHYSPKTSDLVYARLYITRSSYTSLCVGTLKFYVNGVMVKQYGPQTIDDGSATQGGALFMNPNKEDTRPEDVQEHVDIMGLDFRWSKSVPDPPTIAYGVNFIPTEFATGRVEAPSPLFYMSPGDATTFISGSFSRHSVVFSEGSEPMSAGSRAGFAPHLFGIESASYDTGNLIAGYPAGLPISGSTLTADEGNPIPTARARCEFARYKDRIVANIKWYNILGFAAESEEGEEFVYSNFDLEEELGVGALKSVTPLGVVG